MRFSSITSDLRTSHSFMLLQSCRIVFFFSLPAKVDAGGCKAEGQRCHSKDYASFEVCLAVLSEVALKPTALWSLVSPSSLSEAIPADGVGQRGRTTPHHFKPSAVFHHPTAVLTPELKGRDCERFSGDRRQSNGSLKPFAQRQMLLPFFGRSTAGDHLLFASWENWLIRFQCWWRVCVSFWFFLYPIFYLLPKT